MTSTTFLFVGKWLKLKCLNTKNIFTDEAISLFSQGGIGNTMALLFIHCHILHRTLLKPTVILSAILSESFKNPLKCVILLLAPTSLTHIQHHALIVWAEEKWSFAFVAATIWLAVTTWTVWCLQSHLVCITYHSPHSTCLGGSLWHCRAPTVLIRVHVSWWHQPAALTYALYLQSSITTLSSQQSENTDLISNGLSWSGSCL